MSDTFPRQYARTQRLTLGDPRTIGVLSYLTPLASTLLLIAVTGRTLTIWIGLATVLIVGAALLAVRVKD